MGDAEIGVWYDLLLDEETKLIAEFGLECILSCLILWTIWKGRNRRIFDCHELSIERLKAAFIGTLFSRLILDES
jgi:hypothetical protein